ncbi:MAG TPA: hypothetical protein VND70_07925 [Acidimicrobiales bacterium]|nr:hypothetical protein [Acidimicrobiales bacterium]
MSALPARVTELPEVLLLAPATSTQRRVERRLQQKLARRDRDRWTVLGCSILGGAFGLTVLTLGVLH